MQQVYMNARCREILRILLESDTWITQQKIADELQVTRRSIYYDLCRINEWLEFHHIPELEMVRGKGILLDENVRRQIEACADEIEGDESYILSPMERVHMIICAVIYAREPVYIDQLQDYDLKLKYESKKGYRIVGDTIRIRAVFLMSFQELRLIFGSGGLKFIDREKVDHYVKILQMMEEKLNMQYVDGILESLAMLLPLMEGEGSSVYFPNLKKPELESTKEFEMIDQYLPELVEKEKIYLCLHLLGARVALAEKSSVNVALHMDHCKSVEALKKAIDCGYSSVMYDGSSLPIEENIKNTKEVVAYAHAKGVSVEGEVGSIGGAEEGVVVAKDAAMYTKPEDALYFADETGVDALAVSIGTTHGQYKSKAKINYELLNELKAKLGDAGLALHGGTGVSDEDMKRCVREGMKKINVGTELNKSYIEVVSRTFMAEGVTPLTSLRTLLGPANDRIKEIVKEKASLFKL